MIVSTETKQEIQSDVQKTAALFFLPDCIKRSVSQVACCTRHWYLSNATKRTWRFFFQQLLNHSDITFDVASTDVKLKLKKEHMS